MALLDDIATFLVAKVTTASYGTQGLVAGVNLFVGRMPAEAPNAAVVVQQYEGKNSEFTMGNGITALDYPRVQISVRGEREDYPGAYAWANTIRNVLGGFVVPDATYFPHVARIEPMGIPNPIGYDDVERPRFSMNFQFTTNNTNGIPTT